MSELHWPDLRFPPINLWALRPAWRLAAPVSPMDEMAPQLAAATHVLAPRGPGCQAQTTETSCSSLQLRP
jgi:hypothetical protein